MHAGSVLAYGVAECCGETENGYLEARIPPPPWEGGRGQGARGS